MAPDGFIIGGIALFGITVTLLIYNDKILNSPIEKTDIHIKNILKKIDIDSEELPNLVDSICTLQRKKAHLHKDIQNSVALLLVSSFSLIFIGLQLTYFGNGMPLGDIITKILIFFVGVLFFLIFCFILRFITEVGKINKLILIE